MRRIRPNEIELKPAQVDKQNGRWVRLLLHKDARLDQDILDETFGPMNWQSEFKVVGQSIYCKLSVWDSEKKEWISKEDVGTSESNFEPEKSAASTAFKRAAVQLGIGRFLYNAPTVFVDLYQGECVNGKVRPKFTVEDYEIDENGEFLSLEIVDEKGQLRWHMPVYSRTVRAIRNAPNKDSLIKIWDTLNDLRKDPVFIRLMKERKRKLGLDGRTAEP